MGPRAFGFGFGFWLLAFGFWLLAFGFPNRSQARGAHTSFHNRYEVTNCDLVIKKGQAALLTKKQIVSS